jgi:hypothetical protein
MTLEELSEHTETCRESDCLVTFLAVLIDEEGHNSSGVPL